MVSFWGGRPVHLVLLILTPLEAAPGAQARALLRTAGLMQSDYLRARLIDAASVEQVLEVIRPAGLGELTLLAPRGDSSSGLQSANVGDVTNCAMPTWHDRR